MKKKTAQLLLEKQPLQRKLNKMDLLLRLFKLYTYQVMNVMIIGLIGTGSSAPWGEH